MGELPVDPRVTAVIDAQQSTFEGLGCLVEAGEPDFSEADEIFKVWRAWNFELAYADLLPHPPRPDQGDSHLEY